MEMDNINQDSIFVKDEESKAQNMTIAKEVEKVLNEKMEIPNGYIEIKLDSLGKLDAPEVLHFRNYSMEDATELASTKDEDYLQTLVKCLNRMVWEKFDCSLLHEKELEEIMCNIYLIFWGKLLEGYQYYLDNTIEDSEEKEKKENIGTTIIDITQLKTKTIDKDFKEPIKVDIKGKVVKFRLPRLRDMLLAKTFTYKKYFKDERELSDIQNAVDKKKEISYEDSEKLKSYKENKSRDFIKAYEASIIDEFEGKKLITLEDKINVFSKVTLPYWKNYEKIVSEKLNFGIDPLVSFIPETNYVNQKDDKGNYKYPEFVDENGNAKPIIRGFSFQPMDLLPTMELPDDSGVIVSYGD